MDRARASAPLRPKLKMCPAWVIGGDTDGMLPDPERRVGAEAEQAKWHGPERPAAAEAERPKSHGPERAAAAALHLPSPKHPRYQPWHRPHRAVPLELTCFVVVDAAPASGGGAVDVVLPAGAAG